MGASSSSVCKSELPSRAHMAFAVAPVFAIYALPIFAPHAHGNAIPPTTTAKGDRKVMRRNLAVVILLLSSPDQQRTREGSGRGRRGSRRVDETGRLTERILREYQSDDRCDRRGSCRDRYQYGSALAALLAKGPTTLLPRLWRGHSQPRHER